jgi:uncharacterized protein (TIGR02246 family)
LDPGNFGATCWASLPQSPRGTTTAAINDGSGLKVKAVLDRWEAAWNASDMTAMWQLATDDVHWVNVVGMHWRGKAEVQKAHQAYQDLLFKDRSCKLDEIESIEPLPGGAFVVVVRWSMDGYRRPTRGDETARQGSHVVGADTPG